MSDQHESLDQVTVNMLHSAIMQTGADVRAVGVKMDQFTAAQNTINIVNAGELARLKSVDEAQQRDIDGLKSAPEKHKVNKIAILGVVMGGLGFVAGVLQALVTVFHR